VTKTKERRKPSRAMRTSTIKRPLVSTKWPIGPVLDPLQIQTVTGWHCAEENGAWDIETLVRDLRPYISHSHLSGRPTFPDAPTNWYTVVFALKPDLLVAIGQPVPGYGLFFTASARDHFADSH
jgi:hypothetical protein